MGPFVHHYREFRVSFALIYIAILPLSCHMQVSELAVISLRAGIVSYLSAFDQLQNSDWHIPDTQHLYEWPHDGDETLCYKGHLVSFTLHQMWCRARHFPWSHSFCPGK